MAMELSLPVNIVSAQTRTLGDQIYGSMLLGVPNEPELVEKCRAFLAAAENVTVEEV